MFLQIIFLMVLILCYSQDCHYSCATCRSQLYTSCLTCPNNNPLTYRVIIHPVIEGTCANITTGNANVFGIFFLLVGICLAIILKQEQIISILLFIQSLSLIYLVEVNLSPSILDYLLQGLTYMMVFNKLTYSSKTAPLSNIHPQICKGRIYFVQYSIGPNIKGVGIANATILFIILFIVVLKALKKKYLSQLLQFVSEQTLDKIKNIFSLAFIFILQETASVIFFSFKYGEVRFGNIIISIFYFVIVIFFTVNQFMYPLSFFREKTAQLNTILGKILCPLFLVLPAKVHYVLFIFLLVFWLVDLGLTYKNRNRNSFNRLLAYKILGFLTIILLLIYYSIQIRRNRQKESFYLGIVCTVVLFIYLLLPLLEIFRKIHMDCYQQKKKKRINMYQNGRKVSSFSYSNTINSKKESITVERQNTLQNIKLDDLLHSSFIEKIQNQKMNTPVKKNSTFKDSSKADQDEKKSKEILTFDKYISQGFDPSRVISEDLTNSKSKSFEPQAPISSNQIYPVYEQKSEQQESKEEKDVKVKRQNAQSITKICVLQYFQDFTSKQNILQITLEPIKAKKKKKQHKSNKKQNNQDFSE